MKQALLELYLSVKIRSDEEIDNYTEEQFKIEKKSMLEVDGFTLIDYIKSSIEILMNMKIEENDQHHQDESGYFKFNSKKQNHKIDNKLDKGEY